MTSPEFNFGLGPEYEETSEPMRAMLGAMLRRVKVLSHDVKLKDKEQAKIAQDKGLLLRDIYARKSDTPIEDTTAILLTPNGERLHPSMSIEHFNLYVPTYTYEAETLPLMAWFEDTLPDATKACFTLTSGQLEKAESFDKPGGPLSYREVREYSAKFTSYRPAPQLYAE